jgi:CHAT domain-containing protein
VPATEADLNALIGQAETLLREEKPADARALFERALTSARQLSLENQQGAALCGLGNAYQRTAQYQAAYDAAKQCLEIFERVAFTPGIARANLTMSTSSELMGGRVPEARMRAAFALKAYEATDDLRGREVARLQFVRVHPRGPETAAQYAQVAGYAAGAGDRALEGQALHGWGDHLFNSGQYDEALGKLEQAAEAFEAGGNRMALGTVYNSLGRLYRVHGRYDEALRLQMTALDLHKSAESSFELIQSLNAVAVVQQVLGNLTEARRYFDRALAIAEKAASPRLQDSLRANQAFLWLDDGGFERAADVLEGVLTRGLDPFPSLRWSQLSYAQLKLGRTQEALASAEHALRTCRAGTRECVDARERRAAARSAGRDHGAALADLDDALALLEEMRGKLVAADFLRQEFNRSAERVYSRAIALKLTENQAGGALETAELARSRALLDLLASRGLKAAAAPATAVQIAATARRLQSTFLLYWLAQDEVFIWVVSPDGRIQARRVAALRARLFNLVESEARRELYDLLIAPIARDLPAAPGALLTIVPDGPLHNLSFAALQDARGRYLIEQYTIHYVPAAALLQFTDTMRRPDARTGDLLLVADPVLPALSRLDRALPRLPGARDEADAIAKLVPSRRVMRLTDASANEPAVRLASADRRIVHFATHAVVRNDDPLKSFLALGPATGDQKADGVLTAEEIYGWTLRADLVVLSACRSGGGRVTGDGIAAFARAFIYAGTPTLVASIWDVADEPTNRLLPEFYRSWLGGQSKARALRAAQLQLLSDLRAGRVQLQTAAGLVVLPEHPGFWAGFAVIGEPD